MDDHDDDLEGALFEAFGREDESVLQAIDRLHGGSASVLLREVDEDSGPVIRPGGAGAAGDDSRYQILGEIARGGIGVVYKGRDKDLNREVALKVLRPEYVERPDVVQRFVEEAQVGGQLQHPGIVPVYSLGLQADGRPSFAMKLVKGRTLAELLENNPRGLDLVTVFHQMAQTVAYAHSRGVIHRDLKPANVMVGAFGEVQVVDWGFAKVLGREEPARPEQTVIETVRSGPEGSHSLAGSVMGTPAYMPPEQAMGRIEDLDERADVFSLGAILMEVLTGDPPYTGETQDQIVAAVQSRLEPALERLAECEASEGLREIVRECLQPLAKDRPRNAGVLADRLTAHFAQAESRAKEADLAVVESAAREERHRDARRRTLLLSAAAALLLVVGGVGWLVWQADVRSREGASRPQIAAALREATSHEGGERWSQAVASARRAVDIARSEGVPAPEAEAMLARLETAHAAADEAARIREEDDAFLEELRAAAATWGKPVAFAGPDEGGFPRAPAYAPGALHQRTDAAYASAVTSRFPRFADAVERMAASRHREAFGAQLSLWAWSRGEGGVEGVPTREEILAAAFLVDPPHVDQIAAIAERRGELLLEFARDRGDDLTPALAAQLGEVLYSDGHPREAFQLLSRQAAKHPGEFDLHYQLTHAAGALGELDAAVEHAEAAAALWPESPDGWRALGVALRELGNFAGSVAAFGKAIEVGPEDSWALSALAGARLSGGDGERSLSLSRRALELLGDQPLDPRMWTARYHAACASALVNGEPRAECLAWLRSDLTAWEAILASGEAATVAAQLRHWKTDPDLSSVRDAEDLPEDWRKLWADVDALLSRAEEAGK